MDKNPKMNLILYITITFLPFHSHSYVILVSNLSGVIKHYDQIQPRISRGRPAKIEEAPYTVRITGIANFVCTGAIIHASWVLTAAHCIFYRKRPERTEIFAGYDDISKTESIQRRIGSNIFVHKDYIPKVVGQKDLALIEVNTPFILNEKVAVLKLSDDMWPQNQSMYKKMCYTAGWGSEEVAQAGSKILKQINVTARHGDEGCPCWPKSVNRDLLCINRNQGSGICTGDSGGALVCDNKGVGVAHIIYNLESCQGGLFYYLFHESKLSCTETVGAFMFICPHLDWISYHVPNTPKKPANCRSAHIHTQKTLDMFLSILLLLKFCKIFF